MKLIGFVCALALAGAIGGCSDDSNGGGSGGAGATGGSGASGGGGSGGTDGTGATGGGGSGGTTGFCTNAADTAEFDNTSYTNEGGTTLAGDDAVAEIAGDCVFGATTLVNPGCGAEVGDVLSNNNDATRAALAACVIQCTVDQGIGLSSDCLSCYGDSVVCGAAFCAGPCAGGTDTPACIDCRCGNNSASANCFDDFSSCSGLPPSNACE